MREKSDKLTAIQETVCEESLQNRQTSEHRYFFGYAYALFRQAKFYTVWKNLLAYFRRIRMVSIVIKILSVIFSILQTGALVIISTAIFLVILPILTAFMLGILLTALLESRSSNRQMRTILEGREVYVLFLTKHENPFLAQNAKSLAMQENCTVLIVSPYWISGRGLFAARFFCTVRKETENIYLVRRYYLFMLKRKVFGGNERYLY